LGSWWVVLVPIFGQMMVGSFLRHFFGAPA
jgi:hypothetical protein